MSKTVYFLGAGATIAVAPNAPLNVNLVKKALEDFLDSDEANKIKNFIQDLFTGRENPPIDNQIWNLLDYIIQEGKSPSSLYNLEDISEIRNRLLNLIIREIEKGVENSDLETYRKFVMSIKDESPVIISTNYDILIDNALVKHNYFNYGPKIRYSVACSYPHEFCGMKRPIISDQLEMNEGNVQLLKIHGSLNWLYCSKCNEVDLTKREKGALATLIGIYCANQNCTSQYQPLLITPTMFKNYENRFIKEVWHHAEKALIEADELIFIGYALKEEDYQIRCLLMKALLNKGRYDKITVIEDEKLDEEKTAGIKAKYEHLYGVIDFRTIGFVQYVNTLTPSKYVV